MKRSAVLLPVSIVLVFGALSLFLLSSCAMPPMSSSGLFGDRVGLIRLEGVISAGSGSQGLMYSGGVSSDHIVEVVNQAIDDKGIKALVVRINSPGGSAAASQEIYNVFKKFSDTGRPVVVSMADVAASGGYYVAAPADVIYANPATLTGSIGVIMQFLNYEGLFKLIGLSDVTITSGEYKDIGSPFRPMTESEERLLQEMLDDVHRQFKDAVKSGRGFTDDEINAIAEGMIYTGEQAYNNGLVDELGGLENAIAEAGRLSGLGEKPVVDELGKVGLLDQLLKNLGGVQHNGGIADTINPFKSTDNLFYRLWSVVLLDPRLLGDNAGLNF
ncbi:MAG TPA: signal peptide peptidase SppA [Firmicutes bacterium]|nr:signal peptide peptidase SppA [Bacillota bacterium]